MDSSLLAILLFALMAILSDKLGGKKKPQGRKPPFPFPDIPQPRKTETQERGTQAADQLPPPMPQPWETRPAAEPENKAAGSQKKTLPFEIPELKGAPLPKGEKDEGVYREPGTKMQDMLEEYREEMADKARQAAYEAERRTEEAAIRAKKRQSMSSRPRFPVCRRKKESPSCPSSRRKTSSSPLSWPNFSASPRPTAGRIRTGANSSGPFHTDEQELPRFWGSFSIGVSFSHDKTGNL